MAKIFLHGLALANYRGIGPEMQHIGPFREINFFVGPNNAGKSTVLSFITENLNKNGSKKHTGIHEWARDFRDLEIHLGKDESEVGFGIAIGIDSHPINTHQDAKTRMFGQNVLSYFGENGIFWLYQNLKPSRGVLGFSQERATLACDNIISYCWSHLWTHYCQGNAHNISVQDVVLNVLDKLISTSNLSYPHVRLVPAIRQISDRGQPFDDFSGKGLIDKLAELQNPPHDQQKLKKRFAQVNDFLRNCTEKNDAQIEIPHDRRYVLVHMGGKVLPLSSLGTGIHEVIMLAAFCTLCEDEIICIEEPEIHLHPLLQRKLIRYLAENTSNQYFIATHSASLIDAVPAAIFSVTNRGGSTTIRLADEPTDRHEICQSLGYRASDLLQSNAIIWVEGPSDRIYLNHWISQLAPELSEGTDYSIMFYGGRLLSHLTANDPEVNDFISLRRLNRNIAILIDSDKKTEEDEINDTKKRIVEEFGENLAWVTAGKEIENYLSVEKIESAIVKIHGEKFDGLSGTGKYENLLAYRAKHAPEEKKVADKIKVAKNVCEDPTDFSRYDLRERLDNLIAFIRQANH